MPAIPRPLAWGQRTRDGIFEDMSDLELDPQALQQEENTLIALRKEKLAAERAKGNAFPNDFRRENSVSYTHLTLPTNREV